MGSPEMEARKRERWRIPIARLLPGCDSPTAHVNSTVVVTRCTRLVQDQGHQNPSMDREVHEVLPPGTELLGTDGH